jgi:hypothetical protein
MTEFTGRELATLIGALITWRSQVEKGSEIYRQAVFEAGGYLPYCGECNEEREQIRTLLDKLKNINPLG